MKGIMACKQRVRSIAFRVSATSILFRQRAVRIVMHWVLVTSLPVPAQTADTIDHSGSILTMAGHQARKKVLVESK